MFNTNDYVAYGSNGVCQIIDIGVPNLSIADEEKQYYTLSPIYENSKIYIPVENHNIVMRKVLTKEEFEEIFDKIPSIDIVECSDERLVEQQYKDILHSCQCEGYISIIKTTYYRKKERLSEGKKLTAIDEKYMKISKGLLAGELAFSLEITKEEAEEFITKKIKHKL